MIEAQTAQTAQTMHAIVAKGAMPPLVLHVGDCRAACAQMQARGVEFTQQPIDCSCCRTPPNRAATGDR